MGPPTLPTKSNWKTTRPATAPMPSAPFSSRRPMQTRVMTPRRVTLVVPMARRMTLLLVSPEVLSLATPASRKRRFTTAMVSPMARPRAAQGTDRSSAMMTAATPTMMAETTVRRSTLASALPPRPESPSSMFTAGPLQVRADLLDDAHRGHRETQRQAHQQEGRRGVQRAVRPEPEPEPDAHADRSGQPHAEERHGAGERLGPLWALWRLWSLWLGGFVRFVHPDGRARRRSLDPACACAPPCGWGAPRRPYS